MTISAPKLLASAGATVTSMIIGSFFGDSGTIYGAAIGSVVSGVASEGYEYALVRSHAKARAAYHRYHPMMETLTTAQQAGKPDAEKQVWPDTPGGLYQRVAAQPGGPEALEAAAKRRAAEHAKYDKRMRNGRKPLLLIGSGLAIAGVGLGVAYGVVLLPTEAATGKTLSSYLPGNKTQYGSSFGSTSSTPPAHVITPTAGSTSPQTPVQSLTGAPSQTPGAVTPSMVPSVTPVPSVTIVPATPPSTAPVQISGSPAGTP